MTFSKNELDGFKNTIEDLTEEDFNKEHPSGQDHVLLKNNRANMGVSFAEYEISELLEILREASLFEEVFSILNQN